MEKLCKENHFIADIGRNKDGMLYFVCDDESRLLECVIEHEDGKWILWANNSIVVRF